MEVWFLGAATSYGVYKYVDCEPSVKSFLPSVTKSQSGLNEKSEFHKCCTLRCLSCSLCGKEIIC